MTVLRAQIRWESTRDAEDDMMNVFHFQGQANEPDNAADMIEDFFTVPAGTDAVTDVMSGQSLTGDYEIKVYDLAEPKPRAPIYVRDGSVELAQSDALPPEIACCLSYRSEYTSGVNPQRRRGRLYIGGLQVTDVLHSSGMLATGVMTTLVLQAEEMLAASQASVNLDWVVFSPSSVVGGDPETGAFPVIGGWVDNAPDVQRRRGVDPAARMSFPLPE